MPYGPGTYGRKRGRPKKDENKKPLSPKQKKIARMAGNKMKIGADDLLALRKGRRAWWHTKAKVFAEARKAAKATKNKLWLILNAPDCGQTSEKKESVLLRAAVKKWENQDHLELLLIKPYEIHKLLALKKTD